MAYQEILTRDKLGRITEKQEKIQGQTDIYDFVYDSTGRLTEVDKNGSLIWSYTYDANNNRTSAFVNGANVTATYEIRKGSVLHRNLLLEVSLTYLKLAH